MAPPRKRLGEILVEAGVVDDYQVSAALTEQKRWGGKLGEHLIRLGYLTEKAMVDALRNQLKIPSVNLTKVRIPQEVIQLVPPDLIRKHKALPVGVKEIENKEFLVLAMSDPTNLAAVDDVQFIIKQKVMPALSAPSMLDRAIDYYLDQKGELFSEDGESDSHAPDAVRQRVDITDGSRTVSGEGLESISSANEVPPTATLSTAEALDQIRAEVTAMRNLLVHKGLIERKDFVEEVFRQKQKKAP